MLKKTDLKQIWVNQLSSFGIYFFVWSVRGKKEINLALGKNEVPSAWFFALPFGGFWWMWQYASALQDLTSSRIKREETFLLYVIAVSAWYFNPLPGFDIKGIFENLIASFLLLIVGHAFFMSMVQSKINKLI